MPRAFLLPALLFSLAATFPAPGQKISVRTMAMGGGDLPEVYLRTDGDEPLVRVEWPTRQPSPRIVALRDGALPLYRSAADEDGDQSHVIAQQVKVPSGAREILLLGWTDGEKTQYRAIEDDFVGARFNDWLLINFSKKPIALKVGDSSLPIKVESGESKIYRIKVPAGKGATAIAQAQIRGEVKTFYSTYVPVRDGQRTMMLFADDGDKIRVRRIIDKLIPPKPARGG